MTRPRERQQTVARSRALGTTGEVVLGALLGFVYLIVVGQSSHALGMVLVPAIAVLAIARPVSGLATLALIVQMRESDLYQPIYVDGILLGATTVGALWRLVHDPRPVRVHPALIVLIAYAVYSAASVPSFVSGLPADWMPTAALQAIHVLTAIGLFVIGGYLFRTVSPIAIISVALIGSVLAAGLALASFFKIPPATALTGLLPPDLGDRASGGFGNANYLGFGMAQSSILALGLLSVVRPRYRLLVLFAFAACAAALIFSYSRSAYIGLLAGTLLLAYMKSPKLAVVLLVIGLIGVATLYPAFLEARLGNDVLDPNTIAQRAQSENWRRLAAAAGVSIFLAAPLFGVGFGVFHHFSPPYIGASPATYSHNAWVQILAEQGIIGIAMVVTVAAVAFVKLARSSNPLRGAALAMAGVYVIESFFINSVTSLQITGLTALVLAAALAAGERERDAIAKGT